MVEHQTVTPPRQVRFPGAARDLSLRVNFQCRFFYGAIACIYICAHVKDPAVRVKSLVDYENAITPSMHRRLGSATLSQLAFPGEGNPNFAWKKFH